VVGVADTDWAEPVSSVPLDVALSSPGSIVDVDSCVLVDVVVINGAASVVEASVVELGPPAAFTAAAVGVSATGVGTSVGDGGVAGWAMAIVGVGAGAVGAAGAAVVVGVAADDVAQSERFSGLGVSPGTGAGGSYPGGGMSTAF
jgi:hypothetical protein